MRTAHPSTGEAPANSMAGEDKESLYQVLVDRCQSLEEIQVKLREQIHELVQEKKLRDEVVSVNPDSSMGLISGFFSSGSPYRNVLECMGHAVHVCKVSSGEIIYWNHAAETLYGWKDYEIIGQRFAELLIAEEYYAPLRQILEKLITGEPWSGQFPFRKRSGEVFMAMVTKTPLYEDGELLGVITVSSDAAVFNNMDSDNMRAYHSDANDQSGVQRLNFKRIQWHPRPLIAPVPQIASSLSNLASKFRLRQRADDTCKACTFSGGPPADAKDSELEKHHISEAKPRSSYQQCKITTLVGPSEKDESATEVSGPSKIAAMVFAKLHMRGGRKCGKDNGSFKHNDAADKLAGNGVKIDNESPEGSESLTSHWNVAKVEDKGDNFNRSSSSFVIKGTDKKVCGHRISGVCKDSSALASPREFHECLGPSPQEDPLLGLVFQCDQRRLEPEAIKLGIEDEVQKYQEGLQVLSSRDSISSHESSSSKGDNESNAVVECEIRWEDLQLGEEIGQGSCAVVYRGIWIESDVAVKVYYGNGYTEETLQDYRKEIDIMKRLRHPNVLLFMGAVYSQERLAIVTEFLPRGSLFKTFHKNNQTLDIRRRLRMALDVARGMNYLHRRNPPIVHRDLKSSNLLVDRNWTVKVGDFGLSRLKDATLLTTKSGRGTPQWMAPEVLRNEPSNEKSDVFSFGVILWELMTQSIPWNNLNSLQVVGVVGFMDRRLDLPEGLDPHVVSIIHDCWQSDPEKRPSFEELIQRMLFLINRVTAVSVSRISES